MTCAFHRGRSANEIEPRNPCAGVHANKETKDDH